MNKTSIEWTDYTSNLIKYRDPEGRTVHGCIKVSPGCANCYASAISKRFSGGEFTASRQATLTPYFDDAEAQRILRTRVTGKRVFVGDMTDVFGEWVPDALLDRMFAVFALRPDLTFQVLTKRPERMRAYFVNVDLRTDAIGEAMTTLTGRPVSGDPADDTWDALDDLPLPNVWLGTSVENQATADERIPELLATPAAVRFLSCEPLLDSVNTRHVQRRDGWGIDALIGEYSFEHDGRIPEHQRGVQIESGGPHIDWVIVGGESGPGARPCDLFWIRGIVRQCKAAGVPVFVRQVGNRPIGHHCPYFNGLGSCISGCWEEPKCISVPDGGWPMRLRDRAGRDMSEWPEDLRVREYPS